MEKRIVSSVKKNLNSPVSSPSSLASSRVSGCLSLANQDKGGVSEGAVRDGFEEKE